jgi:cellulose biosynthesis protein BcsQ
MFAPASFGAVLDAASSASSTAGTSLPERPAVAFYGFRGGSGRTTALAHVAAKLAARGRSVVVLDLDLEAPGVSAVFDAQPSEGTGALALLRIAETAQSATDDRLRIAPHLAASGAGLSAVRVIPAGELGPKYYSDLDLLSPALWHVMEGPSPLRLLLDRIRAELTPDVILIDCRTGLAALSAAALFHEADVVVACFSATRQSHRGAEEVIKALAAAQSRRDGRPAALLVPTMFQSTDLGRALQRDLVDVLRRAVEELDESEEDPALSTTPIQVVVEGVAFHPALADSDGLTPSHAAVAGGAYDALVRELDALISGGAVAPSGPAADWSTVLRQLEELLPQLAFAEDATPRQVEQHFLQPGALHTILAPSTYYVVGAKGAGKSWLYKRLVMVSAPLDQAQPRFLRGHGPRPASGRQDPELTPDELREIDAVFNKKTPGFEATFWRLRAAAEIGRNLSQADRVAVLAELPTPLRQLLSALSDPERPIVKALTTVLGQRGVATVSSDLVRQLDRVLLARGHQQRFVLVYDALDSGFGSTPADLTRRRRFVGGLVEALEELRGTLNLIGFKVLLREDVFVELELQNKSHLDSARVDLEWKPVDTWKLALRLACKSDAYRELVLGSDPRLDLDRLPDDAERLRRLLVPLWGERLERGNKVQAADFVARRTADGKGRLFPRTLVQFLFAAVQAQRARGQILPDRALASAALQEGYREASEKRLNDLKAEYQQLSPFFGALKGMNPTATRKQLAAIMVKKVTARSRKEPGGSKVVDRLIEIGVLREYKRAVGEAGEPKYEVALLYRPALGVKLVGV